MASQNCFLCSSDFGNLPLMVTTICRHIVLQNCFNNWVKDRTSCSVCHLPVMFENLPPFCALGAYPRHNMQHPSQLQNIPNTSSMSFNNNNPRNDSTAINVDRATNDPAAGEHELRGETS